ncbi:MAG TPA: tetratricopeptide repeat protein, partial [Polyangiaceae bacterium]|nr:tetratricopeptide repeat protein [Polyangiaceae bacterium]
ALNGLPGSKPTPSAPAASAPPVSVTPPESTSRVQRESEPNPGEVASEEGVEPCRGADGPGCDSQCAGKNANRCFRVGAMYREGKNVAQDKHHAAALFEAACTARSAAACLALGHMYLKGDGISADPKRAMHLFEDACARGSADGCVELGRLLRPK